jgi:hypothetical protein
MTEPLPKQCAALKALKAQRDIAKKKYEDLDHEFKRAQFRLMEEMRSQGVESLKVGGTLFVPTETVYAQVQDRSEFVRWAQENDDELIDHRERKEVLSQLVRQKLDDGEPLPPGVGFYVREYISQRAA